MALNLKTIEKERARREKLQAVKIELDPNFISQNNLIKDTSRYIAAQCSRRAGKTNALAIKFFETLKNHPKSICYYIALTNDSAMEIMWPVLQELNDKFKLGYEFTPSKRIMSHANGAKLKIYGSDTKNFIKRLKGRKTPGVGIDEAQDFGPHLQSLIDDVITPMLADYEDSWLALTGTPGPVPQGYFFDVTQNSKYGYSLHKWSLLENPYMPDPAAFIDDLKKRREWDDNHPTLLREWKNNWILDTDSLWIRYTASKNDYKELPTLSKGKKYSYILGVDWGFKDSDALAVLAYSDESPITYLVEELVTPRQGITELTNQIQEIRTRYDISKIIMDEGAGGKKMAEEMRRQHAIPVEPAEKQRKQETVDFFNDALRTGRFLARSSSRFVLDSYLVQIDWERSRPDKLVIKKNPHSDIIDAVIYAFKCSPAYAWEKAPTAPPKVGSKEWADQQQSEMWNKATEFFEQQQEMQKKLWGSQD